jgi:nucleoside-diphosphate-sugar epimerase
MTAAAEMRDWSQPVASLQELEDLLSTPTPDVVQTMARMEGDLMLLGVGGKMGPSLARMAKRASDLTGVRRRVIGVARFTSRHLPEELRTSGVETISCDLLDERAVLKLPDAPNLIFLAGMKFGTTGNEALTWAMNTHLPAIICRRFPESRIVAFSTGNVYGLVPSESGGSRETDLPAPVGEYAMSCLGRERIFEHFSRTNGTRVSIVRLNYACDLRYGILVDLAQKIMQGIAVDLGMHAFNTIWQGDANAMSLRCFDHVAAPPFVVNLTGPESITVREACERLGQLLGKTPSFTGKAQTSALLSNAKHCCDLFGRPVVSVGELASLVAAWIARGGPTLNKPTHFESLDGRF